MFPELPFLHAMLRGGGTRVDGYITETDGQRRWLMEKHAIPARRVTAVPPGFDAVRIRQAQASVQRDSESSPAIVFSGRLHRWKGVFELVEAFSFLVTEYPRWNLYFVGDGPARSELERDVQEKGLEECVTFWGNRPYAEALRIVARAQVFVLPSYIESFPLSLLEAMAMGIPSIATNVGGIGDQMIEPGITGLLIPPKQTEALQSAMLQLVSDPEKRLYLGINGRERVKDLTFARMANSTEDFYTRVLRRYRADTHGSIPVNGSKTDQGGRR